MIYQIRAPGVIPVDAADNGERLPFHLPFGGKLTLGLVDDITHFSCSASLERDIERPSWKARQGTSFAAQILRFVSQRPMRYGPSIEEYMMTLAEIIRVFSNLLSAGSDHDPQLCILVLAKLLRCSMEYNDEREWYNGFGPRFGEFNKSVELLEEVFGPEIGPNLERVVPIELPRRKRQQGITPINDSATPDPNLHSALDGTGLSIHFSHLPGLLREIVGTVRKTSITTSEANDFSTLNRLKLFLEDYTGCCWQWWPLSSPLRNIRPGNRRIEYILYGHKLQLEVSEQEAHLLTEVFNLMDNHPPDCHCCSAKSLSRAAQRYTPPKVSSNRTSSRDGDAQVKLRDFGGQISS